VALLVAILLAFFVLPPGWNSAAVVVGASVEVIEAWWWLRWTRRRRSVVGVEALVGREAEVVNERQVRVAGELWSARSREPLVPGERVRVEAVEGLTLLVFQKHKGS
jgi:membrane protein implicated in regulation of membrane protease activity